MISQRDGKATQFIKAVLLMMFTERMLKALMGVKLIWEIKVQIVSDDEVVIVYFDQHLWPHCSEADKVTTVIELNRYNFITNTLLGSHPCK